MGGGRLGGIEIERACGKMPLMYVVGLGGLASVYDISLRTYRKGSVENMGGHGNDEILNNSMSKCYVDVYIPPSIPSTNNLSK